MHPFFFRPVELGYSFLAFLCSNECGLLVLRFFARLGKGVLLGDVRGLLVEVLGGVSAEEALGVDEAFSVFADGAEVVVVDVEFEF